MYYLIALLMMISVPTYATTKTDQAEQDLRAYYRSFQQAAKTPATYYCQNAHWPNQRRNTFHQQFKPGLESHYRWDLLITPTTQNETVNYRFDLKPISAQHDLKIIGYAHCEAHHLSTIDVEIVAPGHPHNHLVYHI